MEKKPFRKIIKSTISMRRISLGGDRKVLLILFENYQKLTLQIKKI